MARSLSETNRWWNMEDGNDMDSSQTSTCRHQCLSLSSSRVRDRTKDSGKLTETVESIAIGIIYTFSTLQKLFLILHFSEYQLLYPKYLLTH